MNTQPQSAGSHWRLRTFAFAAVLVIAGIALWLRATPDVAAQDAPGTPDAAGSVLPVAVERVRIENGYDVTERYVGRVVSRRASDLGFERSGLLVEVTVDEGGTVTAGEFVARLHSTRLAAERDELRADRNHRQAKLRETEARLQFARLTVDRRRALLQSSSVSRHAFDEAEKDVDALEAALRADAAAIAQADAKIASLDVDILRSQIKAPYDGQVVARLIDEGTVVVAGTPVVRVIETGAKQARIGLASDAARRVRVGETYTLEIADEQISARLKAILAVVDAESRTVPAVFEFPDPDNRFRSGDLAHLVLASRVAGEGFWAPVTALVTARRGLWSVYSVSAAEPGSDSHRVERQEIQIIYTAADRVFVRGTLRDDAEIVASGVHRIVPGQRVRIRREGGSSS
jgi:RND family efflux transporter MFP subunit